MKKILLVIAILVLDATIVNPITTLAQVEFQQGQGVQEVPSNNDTLNGYQDSGAGGLSSPAQPISGPGVLWFLLLVAGVAIAYLLIQGGSEEGKTGDINFSDVAYGYKGGKTKHKRKKRKVIETNVE